MARAGFAPFFAATEAITSTPLRKMQERDDSPILRAYEKG